MTALAWQSIGMRQPGTTAFAQADNALKVVNGLLPANWRPPFLHCLAVWRR